MTINYQQPFYQGPYNGYPYIYPQPPLGGFTPDLGINPNQIYNEQSYIENILRLNKGKVGTFHMTYSDSLEWRDKVYKGVVLAAGKDHIVISDQRDGKRYILLLVYYFYSYTLLVNI